MRPQSSLARFQNSITRIEQKFKDSTGLNNAAAFPRTDRKQTQSVHMSKECKLPLGLIEADETTPSERIKQLCKPQKIILKDLKSQAMISNPEHPIGHLKLREKFSIPLPKQLT